MRQSSVACRRLRRSNRRSTCPAQAPLQPAGPYRSTCTVVHSAVKERIGARSAVQCRIEAHSTHAISGGTHGVRRTGHITKNLSQTGGFGTTLLFPSTGHFDHPGPFRYLPGQHRQAHDCCAREKASHMLSTGSNGSGTESLETSAVRASGCRVSSAPLMSVA